MSETIMSMGSLAMTAQGICESTDYFPPPTYDDWLEFGKKLFILKQAVQWAIGDWINYGESHYGEKYAQALDVTDVSLHTLQNYAWLAKSFDTSRRRENLSWSHHEAVSGIKDISEQDDLLDIAEHQQLGRDELRDLVKHYKATNNVSEKQAQLRDVNNRVYRVIEGKLVRSGKQYLFVPNEPAELENGEAELYLYEYKDNAE